MLNALGLLQQLDVFAHDPQRQLLGTYRDAACPVRIHLLSPFQGSVLNGNQSTFNIAMSQKSSVSVAEGEEKISHPNISYLIQVVMF